jgi:hypothetical protein
MNPEPPPIGTDIEPASSLIGRMANVFAAPGEVFDEIKLRPVVAANWVVPMILSIVIGWISAGLIFSQDFTRQQMGDAQEAAMRKPLEKLKSSGKLNDSQMEQALEQNKKIAYIAVVIGGVAGVPFGMAISLFLGGAILWLVGTKALKGQFPFLKGVEVLGLASLISILGGIVKTLLVLVKGSIFASPSLALLLKDTNPTDPSFSLLSLANVFSLWYLSVASIGLARIAGASVARAAAWVFGIWIIVVGGMTSIGVLINWAVAR